MQTISTAHFGDMAYNPEKVITFPLGIPGYPDYTRYLLIAEEGSQDTFYWLQSIDDSEVAFAMMDVYRVLPHYNPLVDPADLADLGNFSVGNPLCIYNIVVVPEDVQQMRVNLRAPVVINMVTGLGKQVVCVGEDYPIRYMIMEELQRARQAGGAT